MGAGEAVPRRACSVAGCSAARSIYLGLSRSTYLGLSITVDAAHWRLLRAEERKTPTCNNNNQQKQQQQP